MITRELPQTEWHRIQATDAGRDLLATASPHHLKVVVVEDADRQILGSWLLVQTVHVECLWVAPAHRGRSSVFRRLLQVMTRAARAWGVDRVVTHATQPNIEQMLIQYHATQLPGTAWAFPLRGEG